MKTTLAAIAIVLLAGTPALPHRLDEYLQATLVSVEKNRVYAEMTLTPGVAVYRAVFAEIDTDGDGVISEAEQRSYATRVLRDLSLAIDGRHLTPRLLSVDFPSVDRMQEGLGGIRIEFDADLPRHGSHARFTLENHHQTRIAAYQVNCLVPTDPEIRIVAQNRNYTQSQYQLDYGETGVLSGPLVVAWQSGGWVGAIALLLYARFAYLWRRRARLSPSPR